MSLKIEKVKALIQQTNLDGILLHSDYSRFWFSSFSSSAGYIFINREGEAIFLIDGRYFEKAKKEAKNVKNVIILNHMLTGKNVYEQIQEILDELKIEKLGIEKEYSTIADIELIRHVVKDNLYWFKSVQLREIKEQYEIDALQRAADIAAETIEWAKTVIEPGMTEIEIANMISKHMLDLGAEKNSFDPIVASGLNGAFAHHHPTNKKVAEGEFITLDIGCIYKGYCSDITRTYPLGGYVSDERLNEIYNIVKHSQQAGIDAARVGVSGEEVDKICRDIISATEYKDYFLHGTGHGVGIEVHELPNINSANSKPLVANNVVTIEPGIYVEGIGGVRIEDTILITDNEAIVLTNKAGK